MKIVQEDFGFNVLYMYCKLNEVKKLTGQFLIVPLLKVFGATTFN